MSNINMIYFSPTGNTKKIVEQIGSVFEGELREIDLTPRLNRSQTYEFTRDEVVILGAPVYAGRIPEIKLPLFRNLKGNGTPAILAITYGNRAYEDALLELKETALELGFLPVAAGIFIGQHTYSSLLGTGRPDAEDLKEACDLGLKAKAVIEGNKDLESLSLEVPGNSPYRSGMGLVPVAPKADSFCDRCGLCLKACPTGAIKESSIETCNVLECINCFACVNACPIKCRRIRSPLFGKAVQKLMNQCKDHDLKSELFIGK